MRRLLILPLIAALPLTGCGGNSTSTSANTTSFPAVHVKGGQAYAPVKGETQAFRYCFAAGNSWPDVYSAYNKVTFTIPGPARDYVCKRPQ